MSALKTLMVVLSTALIRLAATYALVILAIV